MRSVRHSKDLSTAVRSPVREVAQVAVSNRSKVVYQPEIEDHADERTGRIVELI